MEKQTNSQDMEALIQKYKDELMKKYAGKANSRYKEEIPVKEVAAPIEKTGNLSYREVPEQPEVLEKSGIEEAVLSPQCEIYLDPTPTGIDEEGMAHEEKMQGIGDVFYTDDPVTIEEVIEESHFHPQSVPYTELGRLKIQTTKGDRSFPVAQADVVVLRRIDGEQEFLRYLQTDESGDTAIIELPAPPMDISEHPTNGMVPYGVYTVIVSHPDYYTTIIRDVQIFSGQEAILPVSMIPLSEKENHATSQDINIDVDSHNMNNTEE